MIKNIVTDFWRATSHFFKKKLLINQKSNRITTPSMPASISMDEGNSDNEENLMELDLLKHKIRRLVAKLQKHDVHIEIFEHEDIEYGDVIGKGGEGIVHKCTLNYRGVINLDAAVKTLSDNSADAVSLTLDEIELLCLAQDHIFATTVKVYGIVAIPDLDNPNLGRLVIVTEAGLMNAMQLYCNYQVPLGVTLNLWSRLAAAMHLIHNKHIIHQDLKPENILITNLKENTASVIEHIDFRIIDMGMARRVFTEKIITDDILGTNGYHPPEVLFEDDYDFRADIFMLGITFSVLLHSSSFLRSNDLSVLLDMLHSAKLEDVAGKALYEKIIEPTIEMDVPVPIKNMLWKMMERQDKREITLAEITDICSREARELLTAANTSTPGCNSSNDSGFGANSTSTRLTGRKKYELRNNSHSAQQLPPLSNHQHLRAKRRINDDTSPTVSVSSTRTCMTEVPSSGQRITRAMKRYCSDSNIVESPCKRTRRH